MCKTLETIFWRQVKWPFFDPSHFRPQKSQKSHRGFNAYFSIFSTFFNFFQKFFTLCCKPGEISNPTDVKTHKGVFPSWVAVGLEISPGLQLFILYKSCTVAHIGLHVYGNNISHENFQKVPKVPQNRL